MEPAIPTGAVVLVKDRPGGYSVGDTITFKQQTATVTHRVKAIEKDSNNKISYRTQGDANSDPDSNLVASENVIGSVRLVVPYLGLLVNKAQTPQGFVLLVVVPATIIVYEESKNIVREVLKFFKPAAKPEVKAESINQVLSKAKARPIKKFHLSSKLPRFTINPLWLNLLITILIVVSGLCLGLLLNALATG